MRCLFQLCHLNRPVAPQGMPHIIVSFHIISIDGESFAEIVREQTKNRSL